MGGDVASLALARDLATELRMIGSGVNPVVAVLLGWAIAGEPLTGRTVAATGVIVAAVVVVTSGRRRPALERPDTAPAAASIADRILTRAA